MSWKQVSLKLCVMCLPGPLVRGKWSIMRICYVYECMCVGCSRYRVVLKYENIRVQCRPPDIGSRQAYSQKVKLPIYRDWTKLA